ncbi:hypothetical protein LTR17_003925 [Elasticomyces elasticus]|nr:hypothetical protein LTR17_003925 [Elasticomyces elasticus]
MAAKDKDKDGGGLYGLDKKRNLSNGKPISSSTSLAFSSQLGALINNASSSSTTTSGTNKSSKSNNLKRKKDDLFSAHNRGRTGKRAKRDLDNHERGEGVGVVEQRHTTHGEALEEGVWARSKRKMEAKARLYAAMKRGDVEDEDGRYAVDFDKKWAERSTREDEEVDDSGQSSDEAEADGGGERGGGQMEYQDEFGRTRRGTAAEAAKAKRALEAGGDVGGDRFTARPTAPANVIYGDTIQHNAFDPDSLPIAEKMDALARKRDTSLTPPPEEHFDGNKEIRIKGTAFMQFSGDADERSRQMEALAAEREETERRRKEREGKVNERKSKLDARRAEIAQRRGKKKVDAFLDELGAEIGGEGGGGEGAGGEKAVQDTETAAPGGGD